MKASERPDMFPSDVQALLKAWMGYTTADHTCETCEYRQTLEDLHLDRSWFEVCRAHSLAALNVEKQGRCVHWVSKTAAGQKAALEGSDDG